MARKNNNNNIYYANWMLFMSWDKTDDLPILIYLPPIMGAIKQQ